MIYTEFNPAYCLRNLDDQKVAKLTEKLRAVTVHELREHNARQFVAHPTEGVIAGLWAINLEFTRRGIGPRWRGIEKFNPSAVPRDRPSYLPDSVPSLNSPAMQQKLLLRWADLQWLRQELGPAHYPRNLSWRLIFADHIDEASREGLFARVAQSRDKPHRIVYDFSVPEPQTLTLKGFAVSKAGGRCKAARKRVRDVILPRLVATGKRSRYTPTTEAIASRLVYAEALELAQGKPTEAALFVRWISGEQVTTQAAHRMREKMAVDLKLKGRAWRKLGSQT